MNTASLRGCRGFTVANRNYFSNLARRRQKEEHRVEPKRRQPPAEVAPSRRVVVAGPRSKSSLMRSLVCAVSAAARASRIASSLNSPTRRAQARSEDTQKRRPNGQSGPTRRCGRLAGSLSLVWPARSHHTCLLSLTINLEKAAAARFLFPRLVRRGGTSWCGGLTPSPPPPHTATSTITGLQEHTHSRIVAASNKSEPSCGRRLRRRREHAECVCPREPHPPTGRERESGYPRRETNR